MLLQMGWVESPPYFCVATETGQDVATEYIETPVNLLQPHKFHKHVVGDVEYETLPNLMLVIIGFYIWLKCMSMNL
jgi:hypothetical protein